MAVEQLKSGATLITGKEDTQRFRLIVLAAALKFKITTGMEMKRGQSTLAMIKKEFGLKGNARSIYDQFCEMHDITNRLK